VAHPAALCGLGERAAPLDQPRLVSLAEPAYAVCHREQLLLAVNSAAVLGMSTALKSRVPMVFGTTLLGASTPTPVRDALHHPRFVRMRLFLVHVTGSLPLSLIHLVVNLVLQVLPSSHGALPRATCKAVGCRHPCCPYVGWLSHPSCSHLLFLTST
jgi:hypothetical protein